MSGSGATKVLMASIASLLAWSLVFTGGALAQPATPQIDVLDGVEMTVADLDNGPRTVTAKLTSAVIDGGLLIVQSQPMAIPSAVDAIGVAMPGAILGPEVRVELLDKNNERVGLSTDAINDGRTNTVAVRFEDIPSGLVVAKLTTRIQANQDDSPSNSTTVAPTTTTSTQQGEAKTVWVTGIEADDPDGGLVVRAGPGVDTSRLDVLPNGTPMITYDWPGVAGWLKITSPTEGWVGLRFVTDIEPVTTATTTAPTTTSSTNDATTSSVGPPTTAAPPATDSSGSTIAPIGTDGDGGPDASAPASTTPDGAVVAPGSTVAEAGEQPDAPDGSADSASTPTTAAGAASVAGDGVSREIPGESGGFPLGLVLGLNAIVLALIAGALGFWFLRSRDGDDSTGAAAAAVVAADAEAAAAVEPTAAPAPLGFARRQKKGATPEPELPAEESAIGDLVNRITSQPEDEV